MFPFECVKFATCGFVTFHLIGPQELVKGGQWRSVRGIAAKKSIRT